MTKKRVGRLGNGKTVTPKILCPCCGRYAWLSQLRKFHDRPLIRVQQYLGGHRNPNFVQILKFEDPGRLREARQYLIQRCEQIIEWLKAGEEKSFVSSIDMIGIEGIDLSGNEGIDLPGVECLELSRSLEVEHG